MTKEVLRFNAPFPFCATPVNGTLFLALVARIVTFDCSTANSNGGQRIQAVAGSESSPLFDGLS